MVGNYVDIFNHTIPAGVLKDKTTAAATATGAGLFSAAGRLDRTPAVELFARLR
jgi:hypothetical protein